MISHHCVYAETTALLKTALNPRFLRGDCVEKPSCMETAARVKNWCEDQRIGVKTSELVYLGVKTSVENDGV